MPGNLLGVACQHFITPPPGTWRIIVLVVMLLPFLSQPTTVVQGYGRNRRVVELDQAPPLFSTRILFLCNAAILLFRVAELLKDVKIQESFINQTRRGRERTEQLVKNVASAARYLALAAAIRYFDKLPILATWLTLYNLFSSLFVQRSMLSDIAKKIADHIFLLIAGTPLFNHLMESHAASQGRKAPAVSLSTSGITDATETDADYYRRKKHRRRETSVKRSSGSTPHGQARFTIVDEGPHFLRTARGSLLPPTG